MAIARALCKNNVELSVFRAIYKNILSFMAKEKIINIRVDAELKRQAKKLAENDGRSLSNWILRLIQNQIKLSQEAEGNQKEGG